MARRQSKTADEIGSIHIEQAARTRKPARGIDMMRDHLLHMGQSRPPVPEPEPVDVPGLVNGRRLEPWEAGLYVEWAHGQRRAELALFAGLIG